MEDIPTTTNGTSPAAASASAAVESSSKNEQITELAMNLLVQGRRHLLVSDIPSAIAALAESSRLLVELYGEFADECAESYYYYGMALLEMARTDCDVLGDAVEGGDKAEGEDSSDEEENGDDEDGEESGDEDEQDEKQEEKQLNGEMNGKLSGSESEKLSGKKDDSVKPPEAEKKDDINESEKMNETEKKDDNESEKVIMTEKEEIKETEKGITTEKKEDNESEMVTEEEKDDANEAKSNPETSVKTEEIKKSSEEVSSEKTNDVEMEDAETASENKSNDQVKTVIKPKNESKGKSLKAPGSSSSEAKLENGDEEDISDDVSNLQLAWEVFELAKNIYQRKAETDPSAKPKLADALIRLAEVAIESENYTSAIDDLQKCLEIQKASFPEDSRSLAETFYQLGVAYTFTTEFKEAVKSFEAAASVIQLRIENLKNPEEKKPSMEEPRNLFHTIEGEIEELETLLPDIREKIADTIDLEKDALRKIAENGSNGAGTSSSADEVATESTMTSGESPNSAKPATDITHLIRKKRKPEEGSEPEASVAKKVCTDAVVSDVVEAK